MECLELPIDEIRILQKKKKLPFKNLHLELQVLVSCHVTKTNIS